MHNISTSRKLLLVFFFFIILAIVNFFTVRYLQSTQKTDGIIIDASGRNKMLSQQIGFYAEQVVRGGKSAKEMLKHIIKLHDYSLNVLKNGGFTPIILDNRVLPPVTPEILPILQKTEELWLEYKKNGELIVNEPSFIGKELNPTVTNALDFIEKNASEMLLRNETLVNAYLEMNDEKQKQSNFILFILLEINIITVGLGALFTTKVIRKEEEEKLEIKLANEDLKKFKLAIENASDQILITDIDAIVLYANSAVKRITGYAQEEIIGKKAGSLWHLPMPKAYYENFWDVIKQKKKTFTGEVHNRRKNGEIYTAVISISPVLDEKGEVIFFVGIERDVTKERAAEETNEELAAIVRDTDDAIISKDLNGKILSWNKSAEIMYGYKENEVLGKDTKDLYIPKDRYGEIDEIVRKVKNGEKVENYETQRIRKNGKVFEASITCSPIHDHDGNVAAISVITHDVTKEKEIEKAKNDFLALASHQLRTPLSGTRWLIETLQRGVFGKLKGKQKEYVDEIYRTNKKMIELVSGMLDILHMESGKTFNEKEKIPVSKLSEDIVSMLGSSAERLGVILKNGLKEHGDMVIFADFQAVKNILESFVSNAVSYSKSGGEVEIAVKEEPGATVFSVKDHGIGIPEDEKERIFQRFYRASNAKAIKPDGTGLGLSLAALIADKIGAKVSFESKEGDGSIFYLWLPKGNV